MKVEFSGQIFEKYSKKDRPVGAEKILAERRTDGRTHDEATGSLFTILRTRLKLVKQDRTRDTISRGKGRRTGNCVNVQ